MEIWKDVPGTGGRIKVSSNGKVRSFLRDKADGSDLVATPDPKGYMKIHMTLDRVRVNFKVHRLVAGAFVPNPEQKPQVNHIDGDKRNNRADNLEWVTNLENMRHAINAGYYTNGHEAIRAANEAIKVPVIATNVVTGEEIRFGSVSEAEKHFNSRHICDVLKGKREKAAGHYFKRCDGR